MRIHLSYPSRADRGLHRARGGLLHRATAVVGVLALSAGVAVAAAPVAAAATTRHVEKTGADSGDCIASACATINYAIGQATSDDIISVGAGTYDESVNIDKPLTLVGPNAGKSPNKNNDPLHPATRLTEAVIRTPSGNGVNVFNIGAAATDVTIDGLTVDMSGVQVGGSLGQELIDGHFSNQNIAFKFKNNIVSESADTSNGIMYFGNSGGTSKSDVVVSDNRFVDGREADNGLKINNEAGGEMNLAITGNVWLDNKGWAINISSDRTSTAQWHVNDNWIGNSSPVPSNADGLYDHQAGFILDGESQNTVLDVTGNHFFNIGDAALYFWAGFDGSGVVADNDIDGYSTNSVRPNRAPILVGPKNLSPYPTTDASHVMLKGNRITGRVGNAAAVYVPEGTGPLHAEGNWWGQAAGPELTQIAGSASVAYDPWCTNEACTKFAEPTTTVASPAHHPGWDFDPSPATPAGSTGAPAYVGSAGGLGDGALDMVGASAVNYYHAVSPIPLDKVNRLSVNQLTDAQSPQLTLQLRVIGAQTPTTNKIGFTSLYTVIPVGSTGWNTEQIDLLTAKFVTTWDIGGLGKGHSATLRDIISNNPDATVYMYGVFRGSTGGPVIDDNDATVLVDAVTFNGERTDFEPATADPQTDKHVSRPATPDGWVKDNDRPTYDGPAGASPGSLASLNMTTTEMGKSGDHVDYFHSPLANGTTDLGPNSPSVPLFGATGLGFKLYAGTGAVYPTYQLRIYGANRLDARTTDNADEWDDGYTALNWTWSPNMHSAPDQGEWIQLSELEQDAWTPTRQIGGFPVPTGEKPTLAYIAMHNPGAVIVAYGVNAGRNSTAATMYVDDVTFDNMTTNFEPNPTNTNPGPSGPSGPSAGAPADDDIEVLGVTDRISGDNRYETAAVIAETFGTADAVVIANGSTQKDGVDALAANYLAGRVGAPILLTEATTAPPSLLASVKGVLSGSAGPTIYVMGKTDSVSDKVVSAVTAAAKTVATGTVKVVRVGGDSRYQTSALAAQTAGEVQPVVIKAGGAAAKTAILTSGTVNADPLSAGPISYAMGIPVLLTNGTTLDPKVAAAIQQLGITQLLVLGGAERVSPAVLSATGIPAADTVRIAGGNRYATSAALYTFALQTMGYHEGKATDTYLGNAGGGFPDVLTSGPLAGKGGAAVLTVGDGNSLDAAVKAYLHNHSTPNVTALGGTERVSVAQLTEARTLAGGA